jgi:lipopolysaccharide transport protein LptA
MVDDRLSHPPRPLCDFLTTDLDEINDRISQRVGYIIDKEEDKARKAEDKDMREVNFHPAKATKIVVGTLFVVILGLVVLSLVTRPRRMPESSQISREFDRQKIEKREQIEYFEVKGEKGNFRGRADRQYIGEDGLIHLEGNVEIDFLDRSESEDIRLSGEEVIYDKKGTHFHLKEQAKGQFKDLNVEASYLDYDAKKKIFRSDKDVHFFSEKLSGTAGEITYFVGSERAVFKGQVFVEMTPEIEPSSPVKIHARRFEFSKKMGAGFAEGEVRVIQGNRQAKGDLLAIKLFPDQDQVESMILNGNVRVHMKADKEEKAFPQKQASLVFYRDRQDVEADEVIIEGFEKSPQVRRIRGRGNCRFKFSSYSGSFTEIHADQIAFVLNEEGKLQKFHARRNATITEQRESPRERKTIEGELLETTEEMEALRAKGNKRLPARIRFLDYEISAEDISMFLENNDLEAKGGVRSVLYPRKDSQDTTGFFSKELPVFITAHQMRYSDAKKRFSFLEKVRSWQERRMILAEELSFFPETRRISSDKPVETILPVKTDKGQKEERIKITAESMTFRPQENLVVYERKCQLQAEDLSLRSNILLVSLEQGSGGTKDVVAKGDVIIIQNQNEGRGEEAFYDVESEKVTLSGNPVLIDKERGRTEGVKLTFYIADGRIVVENKNRERSVTVIKS